MEPVHETVTLAGDQEFDFDKADLKPKAQQDLDELAAHIARINVDSIAVIGHTDSVGADAYNDKLSERRANSVRDYLVSKGVDPNKIQASGRGKREPVADNKTKEGRAKNRRVEVKIEGSQTKFSR